MKERNVLHATSLGPCLWTCGAATGGGVPGAFSQGGRAFIPGLPAEGHRDRAANVVAEAVADAAGVDVPAATDAELAEFWLAGFYGVRTREASENSALAVRAALGAAPYLLRRQEWRIASILLGDAAGRDDSPELVQAVLSLVQQIADATGAPDDAVVLARVLRRVNPAEARQLLPNAMGVAEDAGEYRTAARAATELTSLLIDAGHLGAALEVTDQALDFIARAGLGTWSKLGGQAPRLQVLALRGDHAQVLAEVDRLRQEMAALPAPVTRTRAPVRGMCAR